MMKMPTWKQRTPVDQLTVLRSAMEGHLLNLEDGTIRKEEFISYALKLLEEIAMLEPYLRGEYHW